MHLFGTWILHRSRRGCSTTVAEFIDPVRELKLALCGVEVGLKGGMTHTPL